MQAIDQRIVAVRSRQQRQWMWHCFSWGLLAGGVLGCAVAALRLAAEGAISWVWIVALVAAGPLLGAVVAALCSRSLRSAAVAIDRACGLKDRTETAMRFLAQGMTASPLQRLQIADADSHLAGVDPAAVVAIRTPRSWWWGVALSAAALATVLLPGTRDELMAAAVPNDVVVAQAVRIDLGLEELRNFQQDQQDEEVERLLKELAEKIEQLKQPGMDPKEALARLSEMEAALLRMEQQVAEPEVEAQLQQIGDALSLADSLAAAGQAMSKGELDKAAEELSKLELPKLDRKTERAITERLEQLQQNSGTGSQKQLREAASQVAQGLSQSDRSKFKEGVEGLAGECKSQSRRKKLSDLLRKQCQQLGECKSACEGECKSELEGKKPGGTKQGTARSGNEPGEKTDALKTGPQMNLTGQESGEGNVDVETLSGPEQPQEAVRQYREQAEKYEALSESVLENEAIPLGHRQTIRRYFEQIRPQQSETDQVFSRGDE